jgi:hypothetical protein
MLRRVSIVLIAVVFAPLFVRAQSSPDAIVYSVKGNAFVRDSEKASPKSLKKGDKLYSPQQVQCDNRCRELLITRCNITRSIPNRAKWTTILSTNCGTIRYPRGGTTKGSEVLIVSPREAEVVRPETFSIKWRSTDPSAQVNIGVKVYLGDQFWGTRVPSSLSLLEPADLQQRLKERQKAGDVNLVLVFDQSGTREPQQVRFQLISGDDQLKLNQRLLALEEESDTVFRKVGRGMALNDYELYDEAIPEFEAALTTLRSERASRESIDTVVRLLIRTHYHTYNDDAVKQLCTTLTKSSPPECSLPVK